MGFARTDREIRQERPRACLGVTPAADSVAMDEPLGKTGGIRRILDLLAKTRRLQ
jgi:hypothetical protein